MVFSRICSLMDKINGRNLMYFSPDLKIMRNFASSMKRRGALLGSNSSRNNRPSFIPKDGLPLLLRQPFSFGQFSRCLKKNSDELVSLRPRHAVVASEHSFQVGEVPVYEVCCVRDSHLDVVIPGKQQRQVPLDA